MKLTSNIIHFVKYMELILLLLVASCQQDHIKPKGELSILDVNSEIIEYLRNLGFEIVGEIGNWESGILKQRFIPQIKVWLVLKKLDLTLMPFTRNTDLESLIAILKMGQVKAKLWDVSRHRYIIQTIVMFSYIIVWIQVELML